MKRLDNKGNVTILICLAVVVLFSFAAYVIDIGLVYAEKIKLSNAMDSAVLAAALELPEDKVKAEIIAEEYLEKNDINPANVSIIFSEDSKSVEIIGNNNVTHFFAPVFGVNNSTVSARAKAIVGPAAAVKNGIRPFAIEKFDFVYGDQVTLKVGGGNGYNGNYGAVALGGTGANVFKNNALYGYDGIISIGDLIDTETGNMAGATNDIKNYINSEYSSFDNFDRDSIRLWTIPLTDSLNVSGRSGVLIIGFGQFFVESVNNKAGKIEITGRFIKYVTNAEIDMNLSDTGTYGAKIVK